PACRAELVVDAYTLEPLHERNAGRLLPTASMIKMLTGLVAADAVAKGEVDWDTPYTVSHEAALVGGSQVYLEEGETFTLEELLRATMIESANDAAFAVAELVAGSEEAFVGRMRAKARDLGLEGFRIYSPNGLPNEETASRDDRLTARQLATIGQAVLAEPQLAEYAQTPLSWFRDHTFQLFSFNYLLRRYEPAMGIKTGYHRRADFNVTAAAEQDGARLIAVLMGCERKGQLFGRAEELFEASFDRYRPVTVVSRGERLEAAVSVDGAAAAVPVVAARAVHLALPRGVTVPIDLLVVPDGAQAPVAAGEPVGRIVVRQGERVIGETPALAAEAVAEVPWWQRMWNRFAAAIALA
ncbi:MAG TPA: D-alanyl-D-alanine carboxypeptidase family protein, partial [Thermoanaerobaculia bacterium]|nr:D-alanyl-D-alanine carboxypeptidase family protein [Thermoanaerobaculia bacterium]